MVYFGSFGESNSIQEDNSTSSDEIETDLKRLLSERELQSEIEGDGYGVALYYGIFCVGTIVSAYIMFNLKDTEVLKSIEQLDKKEDIQLRNLDEPQQNTPI